MSMLMSDHTWCPTPTPPPLLLCYSLHKVVHCPWPGLSRAKLMGSHQFHLLFGHSPSSLAVPSAPDPLLLSTGPGARAPFVNDLPPQRMRWVRRCVHSIKQLPPLGLWKGGGDLKRHWLLVTGYWSLVCGMGIEPGNKCSMCGMCRMPALHLQLPQGQKGCNRCLH